MKRVTGIGGIFFTAQDPVALRTWYQEHLGIDVQDWGGAVFRWTDAEGNATTGTTIWTVSDAGGSYLAPSTSSFMVNYRVADLDELIHELRACARQDREVGIREVRLGYRSRRQQGRALGTTGGSMSWRSTGECRARATRQPSRRIQSARHGDTATSRVARPHTRRG